MSTPCQNCGCDTRVCNDCDFYNGKYIEKSVIDDIKAEIEALYPTYTLAQIIVCDKCLDIIDKHMEEMKNETD